MPSRSWARSFKWRSSEDSARTEHVWHVIITEEVLGIMESQTAHLRIVTGVKHAHSFGWFLYYDFGVPLYCSGIVLANTRSGWSATTNRLRYPKMKDELQGTPAHEGTQYTLYGVLRGATYRTVVIVHLEALAPTLDRHLPVTLAVVPARPSTSDETWQGLMNNMYKDIMDGVRGCEREWDWVLGSHEGLSDPLLSKCDIQWIILIGEFTSFAPRFWVAFGSSFGHCH